MKITKQEWIYGGIGAIGFVFGMPWLMQVIVWAIQG